MCKLECPIYGEAMLFSGQVIDIKGIEAGWRYHTVPGAQAEVFDSCWRFFVGVEHTSLEWFLRRDDCLKIKGGYLLGLVV